MDLVIPNGRLNRSKSLGYVLGRMRVPRRYSYAWKGDVVATVMILLFFLPCANPIDIGSRREIFVDRYVVEKLEGATLELQKPRDEGIAFAFDKPWEGAFCGYVTMIQDAGKVRAYYRGLPSAGKDGSAAESTCLAESPDGIHWSKPSLGLFEANGSKDNNIVLGNAAPYSHNFSPLIDPRPHCPADQRFKALAGTMESDLVAFASADGLSWRRLRSEPVITKAMAPFPYMFDSQNLGFWSEAEGKFISYFRVVKDGVRRIARSESSDFLSWSKPVLMEYRGSGGEVPIEHLYTNQTSPYFRAPHIYISIAARFMPGRQVLSDQEAKAIGVNPSYFKDTSDAVLLSTRGGAFYDREFLEGFVRPGIGARNWVSRTNYPALNVVQTGPTEMSVYVNQDYAQPTAHLHRYSLRLDGFASVHAPYRGGEMVTKPIVFAGKRLVVNLATSAAGGLKVEIQDDKGRAIPGFAASDCPEIIGNEIERAVSWKAGTDVSKLAGRPVRLHFALADADLFSFRFAP